MKELITRSFLKASIIVLIFLLLIIVRQEYQRKQQKEQWVREMRQRQEQGYTTATRGGHSKDTTKTICHDSF